MLHKAGLARTLGTFLFMCGTAAPVLIMKTDSGLIVCPVLFAIKITSLGLHILPLEVHATP